MDIADLALAHMNRMSKNEKLGYLAMLEKKIYDIIEREPMSTNVEALDTLIKIEQLRQMVDK